MGTLGLTLEYALAHQEALLGAVRTHLALSGLALAIAAVVGLPLGVWAARSPRFARVAIPAVGAIRVVPSLAVLVVVLPYLGLGFAPALVALTVLALPPLLVNAYAGVRGVDPAVVEAARAMGMSAARVLGTIQAPLAAPVVLAGVRIAAVEVIASATLAAFIGGGGLGEFIVNGLGMADLRVLLAGAIPVALLALAAEGCLGLVERVVRRATT